LFEVLNSLAMGRRSLLMAARLGPAAASFALPDLASRAAGAVLYRLQPLGEEDQIAALIEGARHRGLELDPAAARFLHSRVPRDMHVLGDWLERLDAASLAAQRRVTVPFVWSLLAGPP
jgi:DnaA family protein